jgi:hypothetical protein
MPVDFSVDPALALASVENFTILMPTDPAIPASPWPPPAEAPQAIKLFWPAPVVTASMVIPFPLTIDPA